MKSLLLLFKTAKISFCLPGALHRAIWAENGSFPVAKWKKMKQSCSGDVPGAV